MIKSEKFILSIISVLILGIASCSFFDFVPPEINIISPEEGDVCYGEVLLQAEVKDKYLDKTEFYINGELVGTDPSDEGHILDHLILSEGTNYTIKLKAFDKRGNWKEEEVTGVTVIISRPPNTPSAPSGPSSGYVDSTYSFSTSATDPDEDNVAYQFDWGDGSLSSWSSYVSSGNSVLMNHSYSSAGTYSVKAKARDVNGDESAWSTGHSIAISSWTNSPPNTPSAPSGPSSGYVDSTYSFSTSATDPDEDNVAYQFDWGDGSLSSWSSYVSSGSSVSMDHSYSSAGTHLVKVKAKDEDGAESSWSTGHSISISSWTNSPPNTPSAPSGPSSGYVDSTYSFSASATDPDGDNVAYQFDWGDGSLSSWSSYVSSGSSVSMDHSYSSAGTHLVKVKAKDEDGAESSWSTGHSIEIIESGESPGTEKWAFSTGDWVESSPAIGSDGIIYVGSMDDNLYAINPDGTQKWVFLAGDRVESSPAIGLDGTIYVGSSDGNLYAINPGGSQKWAFPTGDWVYSSPAIGSDGTIYVGSYNNNLYAINPDGSQKWAFSTGKDVHSSPAIGSDGTIYVGSYNNLYAINPDGSQKWVFLTGGIVRSSPAIGSDGTIYVGSYENNNLYAINPDGSQKWAFPTGGNVYSSPAIGSDGTIYVGSYQDNNLYAINPDGTQKWVFSTGYLVTSSPAIGSDGTIYVGSYNGNLYAINPDGSQKWAFSTGDWVTSSPAIGSDGTIYVGSINGNLYAIYSSSGGLANTPWPMFHHDLKHSGRVGGP